jgi:hypothetical protein
LLLHRYGAFDAIRLRIVECLQDLDAFAAIFAFVDVKWHDYSVDNYNTVEYPVKGRDPEGLVGDNKNTNGQDPPYPCTQCGACCKALNLIETTLPYDESGRCAYLVDTISAEGRAISVCSVYEDRVKYGCPTLNSVKPVDVPWFDYYAFMIRSCGLLQEAQGMDLSYKPHMDLDLASMLLTMSEE